MGNKENAPDLGLRIAKRIVILSTAWEPEAMRWKPSDTRIDNVFQPHIT